MRQVGAAHSAIADALIRTRRRTLGVEPTRLEQVPSLWGFSVAFGCLSYTGSGIKEIDEVVIDDGLQSGHERGHCRVARHPGGVRQHLLAPDQAGIFTQVDDVLEEASKHWQAEPLANLHEAGPVRKWLIRVVPDIPAVRQIEIGQFD